MKRAPRARDRLLTCTFASGSVSPASAQPQFTPALLYQLAESAQMVTRVGLNRNGNDEHFEGSSWIKELSMDELVAGIQAKSVAGPEELKELHESVSWAYCCVFRSVYLICCPSSSQAICDEGSAVGFCEK